LYPEVAAAIILDLVEKRRTSLRSVALEYFRRHKDIEYLKPVVRVLTLNVLRNYILLDYIAEIAGLDPRIYRDIKRWLLRILVYEVTHQINKLKKSRVSKIANILKLKNQFINTLKNIDVEGVRRKLIKLNRIDIAYSIPYWMILLFKNARIPYLEKFLETLLHDPNLWIRVSTHKISRIELVKLLKRMGYKVREDSHFFDCIEVIDKRRSLLAKTIYYHKGYYTIQDKSSILIGHVAYPSNKIVLDTTAGAGLKTTHMVQLGALRVIAQDIDFKRLLDAHIHAKRLGLADRIFLINTDSTKKIFNCPDIVLIDPPCTGLGRLSIQPELKLHLSRRYLNIVRRLQYQLLHNVIKNVRRGTRIIYSTCTVTVEENEDLVKMFEKEGYIEVIRHKPFIGFKSFIDERIQRLYPHLHKTQGFAVTVMERT